MRMPNRSDSQHTRVSSADSRAQMTNGVVHQPSLEDLALTSGDRARRGDTGTPDESAPTRQPIEPQQIPYEISSTLEHIVGQLDIITQVCLHNVVFYDVLMW